MAGSEISNLPLSTHNDYAVGEEALESQESGKSLTNNFRQPSTTVPLLDSIPTGVDSLSQKKSLALIYPPSTRPSSAFTTQLIPALGDRNTIQKAIERMRERDNDTSTASNDTTPLNASKSEDDAVQSKIIMSLLECVEEHSKTLSEIYAKMQGVAKG